jgi:hypothetical protein
MAGFMLTVQVIDSLFFWHRRHVLKGRHASATVFRSTANDICR